MIFFDYLFYRVYSAHAKKDDLPFFSGVSFVTLCFSFLFFAVYAHSLFLLTGAHAKKWWFVLLIVVIHIVLSLYYKKRKKKILKRFKDSKLNIYIPYWLVLLSLFLFLYMGAILGASFESLTK